MSSRQFYFADKQFYHIYNHTVGDEEIFDNSYLLNRSLGLIDFYRFKTPFSYSELKKMDTRSRVDFLKKLMLSKPLVKLYAFSIMPNHFHFLLSQDQKNGVSKFISNFQNGIAKYYNLKSNRRGTLFCRPFKRVIVDREDKFIHISRYIHLNPVTSYMIKIIDLDCYQYTSFSTYMKNVKYKIILCNKSIEL